MSNYYVIVTIDDKQETKPFEFYHDAIEYYLGTFGTTTRS